jgi:hypothetical protein
MTVLAQLNPAAGGVLAYLGTFLLAALFYTLTAHIAARYVLGTVPLKRAAIVGLVPAAIALLLQQYGPAIVIAVSLAADFLAIRVVYRLKYRTTTLVAVAHCTVSALLGITIFNLVSLLGTAPG